MTVNPSATGDLLVLVVAPHDAGPTFGWPTVLTPSDIQTPGAHTSSWAELPYDQWYYSTGGSFPPYVYNLTVFFATVLSPVVGGTVTVQVDSATALGGNGAWAGSASAILFDYQNAVLCTYGDSLGRGTLASLSTPLTGCNAAETVLGIVASYTGQGFSPTVPQTPQFECVNAPPSSACPGRAYSPGANTVLFAESYSTPSGGGTYNPLVNLTVNESWGEYAVALEYCPTCNDTVTFNESGLPVGTTWDVVMNGVSMTTTVTMTSTGLLTGTNITFVGLCNGTNYTYVVSTPPGYTATPASGTFTLTVSSPGGELYIPVVFVKPCVDTVTIDETGLTANGLAYGWAVTLTPIGGGPTITLSSNSQSVTATGVCPGNYTWVISRQSGAYVANPSSGVVTVPFSGPLAQGEAYIGIVFSEAYCDYKIVFWESGLPLKSKWAVNFAGATKGAAVSKLGSSITFSLPNSASSCGVYYYNVTSPKGYVVPYPTLPGNLTLVPFDKGFSTGVIYQVIFFTQPSTVIHSGCNDTATFDETGLTVNGLAYGWAVSLTPASGGPTVTVSSNTNSLTFTNLCPGVYSWVLSRQSGAYVANPSSGNVTVPYSGPLAYGEGYVGIVFSELYCSYSVVFWESGLPAKSRWSVTFDGMTKVGVVGALGGSITFTLPNAATSCGTFSFTVTPPSGYVVPYPALPGSLTLVPYDKGFSTGTIYQVVFFAP